jgi:hypothetical protein
MGVIRLMAHRALLRIGESEHELTAVSLSPFMAIGARGYSMGTGKLEAEFHLVLSPTEVRRGPRARCMAGITTAVVEGPVVSIQMAGGAILVLRPGIGPTQCVPLELEDDPGSRMGGRRMTHRAVRPIMGTDQRKISGSVVEPGFQIHLIDSAPTRGGVARRAPPRHLATMGIGMTGNTVRGSHRIVSNHPIPAQGVIHNVAPRTFDPLMKAIQREGGLVMVEDFGFFPFFSGMAGGTFTRLELTCVRIVLGVARTASGA